MSKDLIEKFYTAFQQKDWKTMQSCYHDDAEFSDPVFQTLSSKQVKAMWHMLSLTNNAIAITYREVKADGDEGSCHWEAGYVFSRTGRDVHNIIDATFRFKDGKILKHDDVFNLWKWSAMALGASGYLLGWSPIVRNKVRALAKKGLQKFIQDHAEYQ